MKNKIILAAVTLSMIGCRPYGAPLIYQIEPHQTAFLVKLDRSGSDQTRFTSEDDYQKAKIQTQRVYIPQQFYQTGYLWFEGDLISTARLISVERKPETREWTSGADGTSKDDQAIKFNSKEGTPYEIGISITAQIDPEDAARFLYKWNSTPLKDVIDTAIRAKTQSAVVENASIYTSDELNPNLNQIMNRVSAEVKPYFKTLGIDITTLGFKGGPVPLSGSVQEAINRKASAVADEQAQAKINEKNISKAHADAQVASLMNNPNYLKYLNYQLRMKELDIQMQGIEKWKGDVPTYNGGPMPFLTIPKGG